MKTEHPNIDIMSATYGFYDMLKGLKDALSHLVRSEFTTDGRKTL